MAQLAASCLERLADEPEQRLLVARADRIDLPREGLLLADRDIVAHGVLVRVLTTPILVETRDTDLAADPAEGVASPRVHRFGDRRPDVHIA
jgi:hypothetical protein